MKPRKLIINLICLLATALSFSAVAGPRPPRTQIINGMQRIITIYKLNHKGFQSEVKAGTDTTVACFAVVFLDWHQMYAPVVATVEPAELSSSTYEEFMNEEKLANRAINEMFDAWRPGLSAAIRENLRQVRLRGVIPMPKKLAYEDIEEDAYAQNLAYCRSQTIIDAVSSVVPLGSSDRGWFSSLWHRSSLRGIDSIPARLLNKAIFVEEYQKRVNKTQQEGI